MIYNKCLERCQDCPRYMDDCDGSGRDKSDDKPEKTCPCSDLDQVRGFADKLSTALRGFLFDAYSSDSERALANSEAKKLLEQYILTKGE